LGVRIARRIGLSKPAKSLARETSMWNEVHEKCILQFFGLGHLAISNATERADINRSRTAIIASSSIVWTVQWRVIGIDHSRLNPIATFVESKLKEARIFNSAIQELLMIVADLR
jgi:hypothetical protein